MDYITVTEPGQGGTMHVSDMAVSRRKASSNVTTRSCESGDVNGASDPRFASSEFILDQNMSNPFNPMTEIQFNLPRSTQATLTVYNVLGQAVVTLARGVLGAGLQSMTQDARPHPSGVYF